MLRPPEAEGELMAGLAAAGVREIELRRATDLALLGERRLAQAQALAGIGSWEWDIAGGRAIWSERVYEIMGVDPALSAFSHDGFMDHVHPDDRERVKAEIQAALGGERPWYEYECRIRRPDGEQRSITVRADVEHGSGGLPRRSTGIVRDVTAERAAERALADTARRLAEAQSIAGMGSWEWDLRDGSTTWSPPLYELFGHDPAAQILDYARIIERVHVDDRDRTAAEIESAMAGAGSFDVSARIVRFDGEPRWVRARGEMMRDDRGELLRMLGTIQDTTAARRSESLLREAEQRFGTAFESTSSGMALIDVEMRRFLRVNTALCVGLGRRRADVLAMDPTALLHSDDAQVDEGALAELVAGRRRSIEFERRFVLPSGEIRIALVHIGLVRDAEGEPLYFVVQARDLTDQRRAEEQVRFHTLHHPLTGLPNRTLFLDRLRHALLQAERRGSTIAVLVIDIDRFRVVNERFGLAGGDHVLKTVGPRLARGLRDSDTVAHLGEDLFAVACEDLADEHEAIELAARLQRAVGRPVDVDGQSLQLAASIGVALAATGGGQAEDLVRDAEYAALGARERGGGRWEVFDPALRSRLVDRLELELELRTGIEGGELRVHYQPVTALDAETLVGYEALVRWEHPERGLLHPGDFLPVAEESGLDVPLGSFVLREACRQVVAWGDEDPEWEHVGLGVNVSARQLDQPGFVGEVAEVLAETGIRPARLRLELTETDLMHSADPVGTIERLKKLGVRVILDDFGTGYSSLSHLRSFPVDGLKIDRSFVADIDTDVQSAQIVDAIVAMARALDLTVVAEGVETQEQLASLAALDCHMLQGFLLGRPVPPADVRRDWTLPAR
ncbi:MAG: EAL domain-containing protein [Thermoleophilaceae bacterium]